MESELQCSIEEALVATSFEKLFASTEVNRRHAEEFDLQLHSIDPLRYLVSWDKCGGDLSNDAQRSLR